MLRPVVTDERLAEYDARLQARGFVLMPGERSVWGRRDYPDMASALELRDRIAAGTAENYELTRSSGGMSEPKPVAHAQSDGDGVLHSFTDGPLADLVETVAACRRLGIEISLNTARSPATARPMVTAYGGWLATPKTYLRGAAFQNGPVSGALKLERAAFGELMNAAKQFAGSSAAARARPPLLSAFVGGQHYAVVTPGGPRDQFRTGGLTSVYSNEELEERVGRKKPQMLAVQCPTPYYADFAAELKNKFEINGFGAVYAPPAGDTFGLIEITNSEAHKAYWVPLAEQSLGPAAVALGDSGTDARLLDFVVLERGGLGVMVGLNDELAPHANLAVLPYAEGGSIDAFGWIASLDRFGHLPAPAGNRRLDVTFPRKAHPGSPGGGGPESSPEGARDSVVSPASLSWAWGLIDGPERFPGREPFHVGVEELARMSSGEKNSARRGALSPDRRRRWRR
jgi:hypothetical protein